MEKQLHFHHNSKFTAMNTLKNYSNASIDDMVFENRNQAYGAYQLRRDSSSRHLAIALFVGILLTSVVTAFSLNNKSVEAIDIISDVIVDVTEVKVPDLELPKVETPKPIPQEVIPMATQKFLEFKPVVDDKVIAGKIRTYGSGHKQLPGWPAVVELPDLLGLYPSRDTAYTSKS